MRINYLLAACAHRVGKPAAVPGHEILRAHLAELAKCDTAALAQITVLRILPLVRDGERRHDSLNYWDVDLSQFKCPAVLMDVADHCFSYSAWVQAIMRWLTAFDYYVLVEDDYYPSHKHFADILVDEHRQRLPGGGFLCSFATDHAAVSNGIVDSATFAAGLKKHANPVKASERGQKEFARTFCGDRLADFTDRYRCLYSKHTYIVEEVHSLSAPPCSEDIFRPIEYLAIGEQPFAKVVEP